VKIAICDDEKIYLDKLFSDLKTLEEYKDEFNITAFTAGEELLLNYTAGTYDIIVLDIEMKTINGMEVAEHIRKLDSDVTIIFLTNYESFATKGYVIGAFRYILKDQPRELYIQQLKETIQSVYNKRKSMPVTINKEVRKVFIDDIIYIEVYGHDLHMHIINGEVIVYNGKLKETEEYLTGHDFVRIDKNHLINANKIKSKNGELLNLDNDIQLYVSRKYDKEVSQAFLSCIRRRCG